jgi:hypothetical protein
MGNSHGIMSLLVQDDSGESQVTTTNIVDDTIVSEASGVYAEVSPPHPELEESIEDCE